jgi:hypothetical protein
VSFPEAGQPYGWINEPDPPFFTAPWVVGIVAVPAVIALLFMPAGGPVVLLPAGGLALWLLVLRVRLWAVRVTPGWPQTWARPTGLDVGFVERRQVRYRSIAWDAIEAIVIIEPAVWQQDRSAYVQLDGEDIDLGLVMFDFPYAVAYYSGGRCPVRTAGPV